MAHTIMRHSDFAREFPDSWRVIKEQHIQAEYLCEDLLAVGEVDGYPFFVYDNNCYFDMSVRFNSNDAFEERTIEKHESKAYDEACRWIERQRLP